MPTRPEPAFRTNGAPVVPDNVQIRLPVPASKVVAAKSPMLPRVRIFDTEIAPVPAWEVAVTGEAVEFEKTRLVNDQAVDPEVVPNCLAAATLWVKVTPEPVRVIKPAVPVALPFTKTSAVPLELSRVPAAMSKSPTIFRVFVSGLQTPPVPLKVTLLNDEVPSLIDFAFVVALNITVPELCVKAPELVKLPPIVRVLAGKVTVEVALPIVKFETVSAAALILQDPVPEELNVRRLNLFAPARFPDNVFPAVAALNKTVPELCTKVALFV